MKVETILAMVIVLSWWGGGDKNESRNYSVHGHCNKLEVGNKNESTGCNDSVHTHCNKLEGVVIKMKVEVILSTVTIVRC